ncbi:restriction endonuclease subunit S [Conexibacter sp. DBS9H8]|uniref:restriction endonuclease subunit S n=1 Tax=Conexibacter sp. DBS9H8 TaxID=2937801 RepID=UPI00200E6B5F|nr:restriction endonuclease subunit S [Conexibacter sp. DBS9H8]
MRLKYVVSEVDDRRRLDGSLPLLTVSIHRGVQPAPSEQAGGDSEYKVCRAGQLVLNRMRAFQGALGVAPVDGLASPDYAVLEVSAEHSPDFVAYLLRSPWGVAAMAARIRGIGGVENGNVRTPRINVQDLGEIECSMPNAHDQQKIADFLDCECARIDELQAELRSVAVAAEEGAREALRGLIFDGQVPLAPIKFYARTGTGHTPSRTHPEFWIEKDRVVPWFTLADVNQIRDGRRVVVTDTAERITHVGIANSSAVLHPAGTVVLSRTASVGFSAIMGVDMAVSQDFMTWTCGPHLEPRYLLWTLRAMQPELRGLMYGSTHKTIYMPDLEAIRIPLPGLGRQHEIVLEAERNAASTVPLIDEIAAADAGLAEYRAARITEAVTGKVQVSA